MVTSNLIGGLGNYLFQIATSYSLAIDNGDSIVYDPENSVIVHNHINTYRNNVLNNVPFGCVLVENEYQEPDFRYSPIEYKPNLKINGYYQSEEYFKHNRESILELFSFGDDSNKLVNEKYSDILNSKTCAIHVRRGNYLTLPNHHPVCLFDYYQRAIELMPKDCTFVVFSDDLAWCKNNFNSIDREFCYVEGNVDYVDLLLMSKCDNNIIANSSFSWWGAWLNTNPNKLVIGPTKWFGSAINHNTENLIPKTWVKI
jgi:hypothetical protein|tara:strand:+ start:6290 stop:7060 length:771 start_codon:yes stop_codon:yes gene_type:complete